MLTEEQLDTISSEIQKIIGEEPLDSDEVEQIRKHLDKYFGNE